MSRHSNRESIGTFLESMRDISREFAGAEKFAEKSAPSPEVRKMRKVFEDRMIALLTTLSGSMGDFTKDYPEKRELSGSDQEGFVISLMNRFLRMRKDAFPDLPRELPTVEELVDRTIEMEWRLMEKIFFELPFPIYQDTLGPEEVTPGSGEGIEPARSGDKIEVFRKVLKLMGIDWSTLEGAKETLRDNQFRKFPYHLIYIPTLSRTVAISDEVGEKTYIYQGIISPAHFAMAMKGKPIQNHSCKGVLFDSHYEEKFQEALTTEWEEEKVVTPTDEDREEKEGVFSPDLIAAHGLENLLTWHLQLISATPELAEAGIICENGIWYFGDAKGCDNWPKIGERKLQSFPNCAFNKVHGLGDAAGVLQSTNRLRTMFQVLGLRVASEEEEKTRWANILTSRAPELAEVRIIFENGVWYFGDAKGCNNWPQIGGRSLKCFPNCTFNKAHGLGGAKGEIVNPNHLRAMSQALGLRVETEEEEKTRWANMLVSVAPELAKVGIICENGIWYFGNAEGVDNWPKIGERKLQSFPNCAFNKVHGLGNAAGVLQSTNRLRAMFQTLGLRVATEEEEKKRWANMIISVAPKLAEVGIIFENGVWYFGDAKGSANWPKIGERSLIYFPNCTFNKAHGLGDATGTLNNPNHLRSMFQVLDLRVATEEDEKTKGICFLNEQCPIWRAEIENAVSELAEVGIFCKNGIWYFGDAKESNSWPQIGGRSLRNFPNCTFNKEHALGTTVGKVQNRNHLRSMFQTIGLRVATEEEERDRKFRNSGQQETL